MKTLVMDNGKTYEVIGENGKYYLCKGTQFRKNNSCIKEVREDKEPEKVKAVSLDKEFEIIQEDTEKQPIKVKKSKKNKKQGE